MHKVKKEVFRKTRKWLHLSASAGMPKWDQVQVYKQNTHHIAGLSLHCDFGKKPYLIKCDKTAQRQHGQIGLRLGLLVILYTG